LDRIQSTQVHDLEAQEHILRYQVPVAIKRHNVGLVVIDSIAANFRPEFMKGPAKVGAKSFANRNAQLSMLGSLLRGIAKDYNIAAVVANQVADRFAASEVSNHLPTFSQASQNSKPTSTPQSLDSVKGHSSQMMPVVPPSGSDLLSFEDPLAVDHQQRFYTGWGDDANISNLKSPSLGLTWTIQLSTRIALLRESVVRPHKASMNGEGESSSWKRTFKVVFCAWSAEGAIEFHITKGGVACDGTDATGEG